MVSAKRHTSALINATASHFQRLRPYSPNSEKYNLYTRKNTTGGLILFSVVFLSLCAEKKVNPPACALRGRQWMKTGNRSRTVYQKSGVCAVVCFYRCTSNRFDFASSAAISWLAARIGQGHYCLGCCVLLFFFSSFFFYSYCRVFFADLLRKLCFFWPVQGLINWLILFILDLMDVVQFSSVHLCPLTDWVVGGTWGTIQQRFSSSLFCRRPLWAVLA